MILSIIFYKKNIVFKKEKYDYNNETMFSSCFHLKHWKLSVKPLTKVKDMCSTKKMVFPDQTALNKLATKVLYLPRKFNEQRKLKNDTIIQHFCKRIKWFPIFKTQNIKPWQIKDVQNIYKIHAYDNLYKEYLELKRSFKC